MTRVPLAQQISEVRREIAMRQSVYPGLVARGKMTKADQTLAMDRMEAVLRTLLFFQANEDMIRAAFLAAKVEADAV